MLLRRQSTGEEIVYSFAILVNENDLQITTQITLEIPDGAYDFYFLMDAGNSFYAGIQKDWFILDGQTNTVSFTLSPVIGSNITLGNLQGGLHAYHIDFPAEVLTRFQDPSMGVIIVTINDDGSARVGAERMFAINNTPLDAQQARRLTGVDLYLVAGTYKVLVNYYDGALLRDVTIGDDPFEIGPDVNPPPPIVVPVSVETTYTFRPNKLDPTSGRANFYFTVPTEIVQESGLAGSDPLASLSTRVALVGPNQPLIEQDLVLAPVADVNGTVTHYAGHLDLLVFSPGEFTWAITFTDLSGIQTQYAYCAQTVNTSTLIAPNQATFICQVNLLVRSITTNFPVATVSIAVSDRQSGPVVGAVVTADGEPIGITSDGLGPQAVGTVSTFMTSGDHAISAVHKMRDPFGTDTTVVREATNPQTVTLQGAALTNVALTFDPVSTTPPTVTGQSPAPGAIDVGINQALAVTFSQPMDPASTLAAVTISPALDVIANWSADNTVLTLLPSFTLAYETVYTVSVNAAALNVIGTPLADVYSFTFTTGQAPDTTKPQVAGTTPPGGSGNVAVDTVLSITFDEAMDSASVESAITAVPAIAGNFVWSGGNASITLVPAAPLAYSTTYSVTVNTGAMDQAGNTLADAYVFSFGTGEEPDLIAPFVTVVAPADGEVGVPIGAVITIGFSEPMDTSLSEQAISLSPSVQGGFSWSGDSTSLIFKPAVDLAYNTTYTVKVRRSAVDVVGNSIGVDMSFAFTTAPAPSLGYLEMTATRVFRPRAYHDGNAKYHHEGDHHGDDSADDIAYPVTVKIPALGLAANGTGVYVEEGFGNPDFFLLFLYLGEDRKCVYVGGKRDRYLDGEESDYFEEVFKSPSCNQGLSEGDIVTINGKLSARVITADPKHSETRVKVVMEIVAP